MDQDKRREEWKRIRGEMSAETWARLEKAWAENVKRWERDRRRNNKKAPVRKQE
jgi:hypothetical protein